ncbi:hypothetical protein ACRRTK_010315 [Alexandromys fortis]
MRLLGIELRTFGRAGSALNHRAIFPAPAGRNFIAFSENPGRFWKVNSIFPRLPSKEDKINLTQGTPRPKPLTWPQMAPHLSLPHFYHLLRAKQKRKKKIPGWGNGSVGEGLAMQA